MSVSNSSQTLETEIPLDEISQYLTRSVRFDRMEPFDWLKWGGHMPF